MKSLKIILSACSILFTVSVFSQTDFRPGFIITNESDTLYGLLDNRGHLRNSKVCTFRENGRDQTNTFYPGEISGYRFDPGKYYVSRWIKLDHEEEKRHVFVEFLVNGIADLFYYRSENNEHYLIETVDGRLVELRNDELVFEKDGKEYSRSSNRHVGLLISTFSDCPEIMPSVRKAELSHKSLIDITSKYHDYVCDGEVCVIYEKELPKFLASIAPIVSLGISSVTFDVYSPLEDLDFDNSFSRGLGIQLNLSSPRFNDKISAQIEVGLTKDYFFSYEETGVPGNAQYIDVHLHTTFLESSLGFKYTYPKGRIKPTVAIGGAFRYLLKDSWTYQEEQESAGEVYTSIQDDMLINDVYWGITFQPGINYLLKKKLILFSNLRYQYFKGLDNLDVVHTTFQSFSLVLGINF